MGVAVVAGFVLGSFSTLDLGWKMLIVATLILIFLVGATFILRALRKPSIAGVAVAPSKPRMYKMAIFAVLVALAFVGAAVDLKRTAPLTPEAKTEPKPTPAPEAPKETAKVIEPVDQSKLAATQRSEQKAPAATPPKVQVASPPVQPPMIVTAPNGTATGNVTVQAGGAATFGGGTAIGTLNVNTRKPARRLPLELQEEMRNALLQSPGKIHIQAFVGDIEAYGFASDFYAVFDKAKWEIEGKRIDSFLMSGQPWTGARLTFPLASAKNGEPVTITGYRAFVQSIFRQVFEHLKYEHLDHATEGPDGTPWLHIGPQGNN